LLPVLVILLGRGVDSSVTLARILMGALVAALVIDGLIAFIRRSHLRLDRTAPAQLHVDQPERIAWTVENRSTLPQKLELADQLPPGADAEPHTLSLTAPPRSRTKVSYELTPAQRGTTAFGDLLYRVCGPMGLCWWQTRWPAGLEIRCLPHLANAKTA